MARKTRKNHSFLGNFTRSITRKAGNAFGYATGKAGNAITKSGKAVGYATGKAGNAVGYVANSASKVVTNTTKRTGNLFVKSLKKKRKKRKTH